MTAGLDLSSLAGQSRFIAFGRFSADGELREANHRFLHLTGASDGAALAELVVDGQKAEVARLFRERTQMCEPWYLHFSQGDNSPVTLVAHWQWLEDDLIVLGEPPVDDIESAQSLLVKLNNRVSELLRENAKKSADLGRALEELRDAQAMLVHREKMVALGQMTAGIAHELNNPLAYVKNNLYMLGRSFEDLLGLVNLFAETLGVVEKAQPRLHEAIIDKARDIDLVRLSESVPRLLTSTEGGAERAAHLVRQLRTFSRLDEAERKVVDLNDSLRAVVEMVGFLLRESQTVFVSEYGDLPTLLCSPGQLNQAVLNVLTNAIQAAGLGGRVALKTETVGDRIVITISDDGPGIPVETRGRIFEPFFTTKDVGEGTGLGLSIAHAVVSEHGGHIEVDSGEDGGAVFRLILPTGGGGNRATQPAVQD